jgi:Zn-dependent peptidase ImmA (M78 family)
LLDDILAKHDWYREFVQQEGRPPLPFVGKFQPQDSSAKIASDISATLQLNESTRQSSETWEDFLRLMIESAEQAGILVMRSGVVAGNNRRTVSRDEFRGFAISDSYAPLIYINGSDWTSAQIFTVAHELVHIWIGRSGISNEDLSIEHEPNNVERVCNAVAAQVLVPEQDFVERWNKEDSLEAKYPSSRALL